MMKIFNMRALTRKQRFTKAIAFGSGAAVLSFIIIAVLWSFFGVYASILYMAAGFGIGYAIQYFGKGVQLQFALLSVGLTLLFMLCADLFIMQSFSLVLTEITSSIYEAGYRLVALYLAYSYSRVV